MNENSANNKRIAKNSLFLYVRMIIVLFLSLFTTRIVLQTLGVVEYGVYEAVGGFVSIFNVLNTTLASGINRFYNIELGKNDNNRIDKVYNCALLIQVILSLLFIIATESIGFWYLKNHMIIPDALFEDSCWVFHLSVLSLFFMILKTPFLAAIMAYERMNFYAIVTVANAIFKLIISYSLIILSNKLISYSVFLTLLNLTELLILIFYCKINFKVLKVNANYDKDLFKKMIKYSGWNLLEPIAYTSRGQGTNVLLNYFFGPIVNAAYGISNQVALALDHFGGSLSLSFRPQIIQSYSAGDFIRTKNLMTAMSKMVYSIQLMLCIPLILEMSFILNLWLQSEIPQYTIQFAILILIVKTINSLNTPVTIVIMATGRLRKFMTLSSIIIISILPISFFILKLGGTPIVVYEVMVFVTIVNQILSVSIMCNLFPYYSGTEYIRKILLKCLLFSMIVVIIPILFKFTIGPSLFRFIAISFSSGIISVITFYFVMLNNNEKKYFGQLLSSVFNKLKI